MQHSLDNEDSNIDLSSYCVLCFESARNIISAHFWYGDRMQPTYIELPTAIARDHLGPSNALRFGILSTLFSTLQMCCTETLKNWQDSTYVYLSCALAVVSWTRSTLTALPSRRRDVPAQGSPACLIENTQVTHIRSLP